MKWFQHTIQRHRKSFLALLTMNVFFMADGVSYVHAQELKRQEHERSLRGFAQTFGVPLEPLRSERPSIVDRGKRFFADTVVPWGMSGSRQLEGLLEEFAEQLEEAASWRSGGRFHLTSEQESSGSGSSLSDSEEPRPELLSVGKEQAKATSLASEIGSPLRRLEKKARTVRGTAPSLRVAATSARAPASAPRQVIPKSGVAPEIVALAESLGNSPGRIFRYVHDEINFDSKWGAGKTALGTLQEGSGTSWEQAWLLQELLTAAGVDARFEWGEVQISTELLLGITGVADPFRAGDLLTTAGMPIVLVVEGSQVVHARMSHAWVKAHLDYIPNRGATPGPGDTWIRMDPSLKRFDVSEGVRLDEAVPYVLGDYLESGTEESPRQAYEAALQAYIDAQNLGVTLEQIKPAHAIVEEAFPFVPGTLRGKILSVAGESPTMPESFQQQLAIEVREAGGAVLLNWTLPWPSAYGRRLELAWPGATSADQATLDLYGGVFQTPPYEVDLKPVLRLDGVDLVTGSDIGSAEDVVFRTTLTPPTGPATVVPFELRAGERAIFAVDFGRTPQQMIDNHAAALDDATEASEQEAWGLALATAIYTRSLAEDVEHLSLLHGLRRVQLGNVVLGVQRGGVSTAPDGTPLTFAIAPPAVDLGSMTLGLFPADGVPATPEASVSTLELLGSQGSFLEGEALTAALGGTHLTAVTALTRAVREGQSLTRVDAANVDAALAAADLGEDAEDSILAGVGSGKIAWIHQNQLLHETWDAAGYVLEDPATGAGGYFVTYERLLTGLDADITFHSPQDLDVITAPTDVVATIDSEHEITSWTLSYKAADGGEAVVLATGSGTVTNEMLAEFDPTLLLNGLYDLVLTARDALGQAASAKSSVVVEGQMKIGHFTLSYEDLTVPVSGLNIEVRRTYDSRDKQQRDFGVGWRLDVRRGSYVNNRDPGEGWRFETGFLPCDTVIESKSHLTVVRLSDREVYRFSLRLSDGVPSTSGGCFATARFEFIDGPLPGATLEILGNDQVFFENNSDRVIDVDTFGTYEPRNVRLTTRDGRIFELDVNHGVTLLEDLNGNQLSITPAGITHSSGRSITFERDGQGRITGIADPMARTMAYSYDAAGDLIRFTDRAEASTLFAYDGDHRLLDIEDARGIKPIRNEFDAEGRLVRHIDALGQIIEFEHDLVADREVVTDRLGASRILEYDTRGNVVRETDELNNATLRTFDNRDNMLTETDPLGHTTTFTYTADNDLATRTDPLGNITSYTYDSHGQILTVTDPRGAATTNVYDSRGNLTLTTDALGKVTSYTYDVAGNRLTATDAQGQVTTYEVDAFGNRTREVDALGHETVSTYDAAGNRLTETRVRTLASGSSQTLLTSFLYDSLDRVTTTTAADGTSSTATYDVLGRVTSRTDPLGRLTTMTYDPTGRLLDTTFPGGATESRSYDAEGRLIEQEDRAGRTTTYVFDPAGRLLRVNYADGSSTTDTYDDAGQVVARTDARGNTTTYVYDAAGRRTAVIDPLGNSLAFSYDEAGNRTAVTDARGLTTTFTYDAVGHLVTTTHADGSTSEVGYDDMGHRTSETDQAGITTHFGYDALGRLASITDALDQVASYAYDEVGNRVSQTDANGQTTVFEYDALGRRTARSLPDGAQETMIYNPDGTLSSHTDFNGATRMFEYGDEQRLTRVAYPDGSDVTFTYTPTGQISTVTDARGTTTYAFDPRDRLTEKIDPTGHSLSYTYDAQGNRTSLTATLGIETYTTAYTYDPLNRLATVTDSQGGVTTLGYDANSNRASLAYPNGVTTHYAYDTMNQLTVLAASSSIGDVLASYTYTLDSVGNRTRIDESDGTSRQYQYDSLYRLTREHVTDPSAVQVYQRDFLFDAAGNRLQQLIDEDGVPATITSTYDDRDRLLAAAGASYGWDNSGNLTAKTEGGTTSYQWDFQNRLTSVTLDDGTVVQTTYDVDGNRVRTAVTPPGGPTATVDYLVDTAGSMSHVVADVVDGSLQTLYTRAENQLIGLYRPASGAKRYYHTDGLGSVRTISDEAGTVTDRYAYTAFGEPLTRTGSDPQVYRFAGEPFDSDIGLYFNRARWLDVATGRFSSMDPDSGDLVEIHRYVYSRNEPVLRVDPRGLRSTSSLTTGLAGNAILSASRTAGIGFIQTLRTARMLRLATALAASTAVVATTISPFTDGSLLDRDGREMLRTELKREVERMRQGEDVIYHYTSIDGAFGIAIVDRAIRATPIYHGAINTFPSGAYATDIPPWDPFSTQTSLRNLFFGGGSKDMSHFVAFFQRDFYQMHVPHFFLRQAPEGEPVPVDVVAFGANLMLP